MSGARFVDAPASPHGRAARIAVHATGAGPLAVLLHGYPLDHRMWDAVRHGELAQRRKLAAIDLRGSSEVTAEEAAMKSAFAAAADETVLLIDSSKLGDRALASALDWSQIDLLVTDLDVDDTRLDPYRPLVQIV